MANRYFKQFPLVKSPRTVILAGKVTLNASGAVLTNTIDFASFSKLAGVGLYQILLEDKYVQTKSIQISTQQSTGVLHSARLRADTQATDRKITINTYVEDGTSKASAVADPIVAIEIHVVLILKDSTVVN